MWMFQVLNKKIFKLKMREVDVENKFFNFLSIETKLYLILPLFI